MREILINWLVDVQISFKSGLETLHLTVALLNRYLQLDRTVGRYTLQLVGVTCMQIAAKYEEIYYPGVDDFVAVCDDMFTHKDILKMEGKILRQLEFNLGNPVSITFLRRWSKIAGVPVDHYTLSKYLLELALMDYNFCHVKASLQAAAACCLSTAILTDEMCLHKIWTPTLAHYSGYKFEDLRPVILQFVVLLNNPSPKLKAIFKKYSEAKYRKVSLLKSLTEGRVVKKLMARVKQTTK